MIHTLAYQNRGFISKTEQNKKTQETMKVLNMGRYKIRGKAGKNTGTNTAHNVHIIRSKHNDQLGKLSKRQVWEFTNYTVGARNR